MVGPLVQPERALTAPRSSSGRWWRWVHSRGVGDRQGLCLLFLRSPLPTQVSSSAPSSTPPACLSVLSACRVPGTVVTEAGSAAPGGLMGGAWEEGRGPASSIPAVPVLLGPPTLGNASLGCFWELAQTPTGPSLLQLHSGPALGLSPTSCCVHCGGRAGLEQCSCGRGGHPSQGWEL